MSETAEMKAAAVVTRRIQRPGLENDRAARLQRIVTEHTSTGPFAIIVAQIDPDAIGSAFGMQEVLNLLGASSNIYYMGRVGHPQNEALCNKFGLMGRMRPMPGEKPDNIVLVDSSRGKDSRVPYLMSPVIVVDHHGRTDLEEGENTFIWVDETAGSSCTMVAEILSDVVPEKWEFKPDLALMLSLGIYTDCKSNTRAGDRDNQAFAWVKRYSSTTDLSALVNYKRQFSFLKNLARAVHYIEKFDTYRQGRILGGLGRIPEKQGDDLAMVADELLRTVGAPLAVTWAVVETKGQTGEIVPKVRVCARSEDYTTNLSEALRTRFGDKSGAKILPDGSAEGGALFEFPGVGPWVVEGEMEDLIHRRIMEWFFEQDEKPTEDE
jgi:nanoRNase/pAp phosphatase (c-di-AMP/oligoRNAs hydrolase)